MTDLNFDSILGQSAIKTSLKTIKQRQYQNCVTNAYGLQRYEKYSVFENPLSTLAPFDDIFSFDESLYQVYKRWNVSGFYANVLLLNITFIYIFKAIRLPLGRIFQHLGFICRNLNPKRWIFAPDFCDNSTTAAVL